MTIKPNYPPTIRETLAVLLGYHNDALAHLNDPTAPKPDPERLLVAVPQGSLDAARLVQTPTGRVMAVTINGRKERFLDIEAFFVLLCLNLFGTGVFIDKNGTGDGRQDYVEVGHEDGITFQRLLADAHKAETVKLTGDHHNLTAVALAIVPGPATNLRGRREALAEALKSHKRNAAKWELSGLMSRKKYQALIRSSFRLFDIAHGHRLMRPLPLA